jgi:ABC-type lipoprotein export system ATPase subunit
VMDLFESINREGQTILMVTHSIQAASHASRVLFIKDGDAFSVAGGSAHPDSAHRYNRCQAAFAILFCGS